MNGTAFVLLEFDAPLSMTRQVPWINQLDTITEVACIEIPDGGENSFSPPHSAFGIRPSGVKKAGIRRA
jgi:hypothetical protein